MSLVEYGGTLVANGVLSVDRLRTGVVVSQLLDLENIKPGDVEKQGMSRVLEIEGLISSTKMGRIFEKRKTGT